MIMEVKWFYYYRGVGVDRKEWGGSFLVGRECGEGANFVNGLESMGEANIAVDWKVGEQTLEVNWKVSRVRADKQKQKKERRVIWRQTYVLPLGLLVSAHHIAFSKCLPKKV